MNLVERTLLEPEAAYSWESFYTLRGGVRVVDWGVKLLDTIHMTINMCIYKHLLFLIALPICQFRAISNSQTESTSAKSSKLTNRKSV